MLKRNIIMFFCYMILLGNGLFAAHPLTTDDVGIVDIGKYELEVGYDNVKEEDILRNHSCGVSFKHGITDKMDVGISLPYQIKPKLTEPLGTTTLGLEFLLIKDIFAFSINNELGSKEYFLNGIISKNIKPFDLHLNFGYEASGDEYIEGEMVYSAAVEYPLEKIDFVGEIVGRENEFENWLVGIRYKLGEITAVNFAYGNKDFSKNNEKIAFGFHTEF